MKKILLLVIFNVFLVFCSRFTSAVTGCEKDSETGKVSFNAQSEKAGDVVTNTIGMKLVYIPAGDFMMGSSLSASRVALQYGGNAAHFRDEHPEHKVCISEGFYMGVYEVTNSQFRRFVDETNYKTDAEKEGWAFAWNGSEWGKVNGASWKRPGFSQSENHPVVCVSWNDAQSFCEWLGQKESITYRLPTEAQREYACRAGSTTVFSFGNNESSLDEYAWYGYEKAGKTAHRVGQKKPNDFGLYDMYGNVWEWCSDFYDRGYYGKSSRTDPENTQSAGLGRVLRGGGWVTNTYDCRSASRGNNNPDVRSYNDGFRVCCSSSPSAVGGYGKDSEICGLAFHAQGEKAGDATGDSVILLTRLTAVKDGDIECDVPGREGLACFEISQTPDFSDSRMTVWARATEENDHTIKQKVTGLQPGCDYWYRVHIKAASGKGSRVGPARSFKTAPSPEQMRNIRFVVITGQGYQTRDSDRGHHAYLAMDKLAPDFIALTGDTVYYDGPAGGVPRNVLPPGVDTGKAFMQKLRQMTKEQAVFWLRKHWHAMYALPIQREFFGKYTGYWQVDDHDYRSDDWSRGHYEPGSVVFREQNPVPQRTYRTIHWGRGLQIWLVEGREFRNTKITPATIWGRQQFEWLVSSLEESDAVFKVLISPTPVVGSGQKSHPDNHGCPPFTEERQAFFEEIQKRQVENLYIVCGDKHRKHHSRAKDYGIHEFCCGALSAKHGGNFWPPVDKSGLLDLLHDENPRWAGGFLCVEVNVGDKTSPTIVFTHYDSDGNKQAGWLFSSQR